MLYRALLEHGGSRECSDPGSAQAHEEICRGLDGLPLAIELAASRAAHLGTNTVLAALAHTTSILTNRSVDRPERHHSLHAVLSWSVDLLDARERELFTTLAALPGGSTMPLLAEVTGLGHVELVDALEQLVRFHLVDRAPSRNGDRFVMLSLVRSYGEDLLRSTGDPSGVHANAVRAYRAWAAKAGEGLVGADQFDLVGDIDSELDNVRAAIGWAAEQPALAESCANILTALTTYFWHRNTSEAVQWHRTILASRGLGRSEALLAVRAALLASYLGQPDAADLARRAVERSVADGRRGGVLLEGTLLLAATDLAQGDRQAACEKAEQVLELAERFDGPYLGIALTNCGDIFMGSRDTGRAADLFTRAVELFEAADESWMRAAPMGRLGELALWAEDADAAIELMGAAVRLWQRADTRRAMPRALSALGHALRVSGDPGRARSLILDGLDHVTAAQSWGEVPWPLLSAAVVAVDQGMVEEAAQLFCAARTIGHRLGQPVEAHIESEFDPSMLHIANSSAPQLRLTHACDLAARVLT